MNKKTVRQLMTAAFAAMLASCSSNTMSEDTTKQEEDLGTPMRFSAPAVGTMESRTRASEALKSGFLVSTYKNYGTAAQQTVMDQYEAKYQSDAWTTTNTSWTTVGTTSDGFYQEQFEKYWDTSAYPYEFLAIAPAPIESGATKVKTGFEVKANSVKIASATEGQTVADGVVTPSSEGKTEYLVAQMERKRNTDNTTQTVDVDQLTGTAISGNTSPTGKVPLPFHHLSAKVRFGIYTTEHVSEVQSLPITNVSFKVKSKNTEGFVTEATGYEATDVSAEKNALSGTFTSPTYSTNEVELLKLSGPTEQKFTDAYLDKHEWKSKDDVNAYYFECKDGFTQVPQDKVQLTVSFTIKPTNGEELKVENQPLKITDANGTEVSEFSWEPNHLYTYYIVVRHLFNHEISFTATVADWEDISGKINTNLEE